MIEIKQQKQKQTTQNDKQTNAHACMTDNKIEDKQTVDIKHNLKIQVKWTCVFISISLMLTLRKLKY